MKIYKRVMWFNNKQVSVVKTDNLFGLWDTTEQRLVLSCKYESLKVAGFDHVIFQKDGKKGVMDDTGEIIIDNLYDDAGIIEPSFGPDFFWGCKDGLYKIFNDDGEVVMSNLPHWNAVYISGYIMVKRYEWSRYSVWSTEYRACRSPLNLLIDELHYPLTFPSMRKVFEFGRDNSERMMNTQELTDWLVSGWYHMARRLDELATRARLHYNTFSLEHLNWGTIGQCNSKAKAILISPGMLRQPPSFTDSVLAHELSHLKFPHHGATFWEFCEAVESLTRKKVNRSHTIEYKDTLRDVDIHGIINRLLIQLYDSLSPEQRNRLPLKKIPLEGVEMVVPIHTKYDTLYQR